MIRVLLADDHQMFLDGLKSFLREEPEIQIVGEALNGLEVLEIMKKEFVDVIVLDIRMPKMNGIEAIKLLKKTYSKTKVIVLTMFEDRTFVAKMIQRGANGYILKNKSKEELVGAIHAVYRGGSYFPPSLFPSDPEPMLAPDVEDVQFTNRELEVLRLVAKGMENKEIADRLHVAETTIITHCRNLMFKLGVNNRVKLAIYAKDNGLA